MRLLRRRTLLIAAAGVRCFRRRRHPDRVRVGEVDAASPTRAQGGTTLAALAGERRRGTEAFAVGASFVGFLVFVTFIALVAAEFSGGTFRALLLRDPHRLRVIVGKLVGILIVAAGVVALRRGVLVRRCRCSSRRRKDISTSALVLARRPRRRASRDYATVVRRRRRLGGLRHDAGRDLPLGAARARRRLRLGRAVREHRRRLVDTGYRFFPGQVLASLIRGGTAELGFARALVTALLYTGVAAAATLFLISRRDVTA